MKNGLINILTIVALLTLIIIRIFCTKDCSKWISVINFLGLGIAFLNVYSEICASNKGKDKLNLVHGIAVVIGSVFVIFAILIGFDILTLQSLWNDLVLLITLLVSLPNKLYCNMVSQWIDEG